MQSLLCGDLSLLCLLTCVAFNILVHQQETTSYSSCVLKERVKYQSTLRFDSRTASNQRSYNSFKPPPFRSAHSIREDMHMFCVWGEKKRTSESLVGYVSKVQALITLRVLFATQYMSTPHGPYLQPAEPHHVIPNQSHRSFQQGK